MSLKRSTNIVKTFLNKATCSLNWSYNGSTNYTVDSLSRNRCQQPLMNCHTAEMAGKWWRKDDPWPRDFPNIYLSIKWFQDLTNAFLRAPLWIHKIWSCENYYVAIPNFSDLGATKTASTKPKSNSITLRVYYIRHVTYTNTGPLLVIKNNFLPALESLYNTSEISFCWPTYLSTMYKYSMAVNIAQNVSSTKWCEIFELDVILFQVYKHMNQYYQSGQLKLLVQCAYTYQDSRQFVYVKALTYVILAQRSTRHNHSKRLSSRLIYL